MRNPEAVDSLEGVARWRLLDEAVHHRVNATHEALRWLVERGVLRQAQGPGLKPVFWLDPDRKEEAERLLAQIGGEPLPPEGTDR